VTRQAAALGWPAALRADKLSDEALGKAWDFCLTGEAVSERVSAPSDARRRARRARAQLRRGPGGAAVTS
jgi:hypothetical protein